MLAVVLLFILTQVCANDLPSSNNELYGADHVLSKRSVIYSPAELIFHVAERTKYIGSLISKLKTWLTWPFSKETNYEVCLTPGCIYTAADVLKNMNRHADPCDNFFEFTCGNFVKEAIFPGYKPVLTAHSKVQDKVYEQLRLILEEPSANEEARPFRMAKEFYKDCMNEYNIEKIGLNYIKSVIKKMGGWPILEGEKWDASNYSSKDIVYKLKDAGFKYDFLFHFSIGTDPKNSFKRVISLDLPFPFPKIDLKDGAIASLSHATLSYIVDMAVMFGANQSRAEIEVNKTSSFTEAIIEAHNSSPLEKLPLTFTQLQEKFPSFPWAEYLSNVNVQPDDIVIVNHPTYIEKLEKLLIHTPKRIQANFMFWQVIYEEVPFLTKDLRNRQEKFWSSVMVQQERGPRWMECVKLSAESFSLAVSSLYVQRFVKPGTKMATKDMVDNIREVLVQTLKTSNWMDDFTRKHAVEKAEAITSHIAYPVEILDISKLENHYQKLKITRGNLLESAFNINKFNRLYQLSQLREPVNKDDWITHGLTYIVNAFYGPAKNYIEIPGATLQGLFFSDDRPNYLNYGALGWSIGHELTHGFDNKGRGYDKNGNVVNWWLPQSSKNFDEKAKCIIEQYGNYTVEPINLVLNGKFTQGENIADIGGMELSYQAYNRWVNKHGTEKRLPGLQDFTPHQMFWISAANLYCSKYLPDKSLIIGDEHSPGEFRVRGTFSNSHDFAKAFNCPSGSNMNPVNKCHFWYDKL